MEIHEYLRFTRNLVVLRKASGLSQEAIASAIGICRASYSQLEQGLRQPDLNILFSISDFYHIAPDALISCDIQELLQKFFTQQNPGKKESRLLKLYKRLSESSKGRLLERAEELAQLEILKKKQILQTEH